MRLRLMASVLTLLCSWVLWEKWIFTDVEHMKIIDAVFEGKSLSECRTASPDFVKERAASFQRSYKESEYVIISNENSTILSRRGKKEVLQRYVYYCLPSTVDPYHDTR